MKKLYLHIFLASLFLPSAVIHAQVSEQYPVYLRNGTISPPANIASGHTQSRKAFSDEKRFVIIQFFSIPSENALQLLKNAGIDILEYIPEYAYTATVNGSPDYQLLQSAGARAVIELEPSQKTSPDIWQGNFPPHALKSPGKVDLRISYPQTFTLEAITADLGKADTEILSTSLAAYQILDIRVPTTYISTLANKPWVQYIDAAPMPEGPLNDKSAAVTRANLLSSRLPSGYQLDGSGVVIGIGDIGNPTEHIDVGTRLMSYVPDYSHWHGVHVAATAAGGGIINEKYAGYAPGARLVTRVNSAICENAVDLVRDFGMVLTNNSYGVTSAECDYFGEYSYSSYVPDRQSFILPYLLHVFAAGNSGLAASCNGMQAGFGNVLGAYTIAKNVITVGATDVDLTMLPLSSKGPTRDGRIKPEIVAPGTSVMSAIPGNSYRSGTGTSMAAPAVTGGLALLHQRYKQLHAQATPKNALMKAILLNGADDKGLPGPDFSYGFGVMNLLRSVTMLDRSHYFTGQLTHGESRTHQIQIPGNTALLKVMLCWNDPASPVLTSRTLINNLDLKITTPGGQELNPMFPRAENPQLAAEAGLDQTNNAEQIVVENPASGNFAIQIQATKIPRGVQEYFVVYDMIETSTTLTYPIGGERLSKNDVACISWDSYGHPSSSFTVSYSVDNGGHWMNISTVAAGVGQLIWTIPDVSTSQARIRIVQNETGIVRESGAFTILGVPNASLSPVQCPTYASIEWTPVPGATDYELLLLRGDKMQPVATTRELRFTFTTLSADTTYFFAVRARKDGIAGRHSMSLSRKPDNGNCDGTISDKDLAIEAIVSPAGAGRMFTSTALGNEETIKIRIRNLDNQHSDNTFQAGYQLEDGGEIHWETIQNTIPAQGIYEYTFVRKANFQSEGTHYLKVFVKQQNDPVGQNDFLFKTFRQLQNAALPLPYLENFETFEEQTILKNTIGLTGSDRYDFVTNQQHGRLRTDAGAGAGQRGITLDADFWGTNVNTSSLNATYNLSGYDCSKDEIHLSFLYLQHGGYQHPGAGVSIRGSDSDPWIFVFDFGSTSYLRQSNGYRLAAIDLSNVLLENAQQFSASFQIKWTQNAFYPAKTDGYTIDEIRLQKVGSDIAFVRIIAPEMSACNSTGLETFSIVLKNNGAQDAINVPVRVYVDNAECHTETVPVIPANRELTHRFQFRSNVHEPGDHHIRMRVEKSYDTHTENDLADLMLATQPSVATFPYFQDFELGDGGWSSSGNTWQFGQPNSAKVKSAASGSHAWKTNLTGSYQNDGTAYLYSPCFDLPSTPQPALSFAIGVDLETCGERCDLAYVEYSTDGNTWLKLGDIGWGTNWYNTTHSHESGWNSQDYIRWHVASLYIPFSNIPTRLRLRFALKSGSSGSREGIMIDDIHIYDASNSIFSTAILQDTTGRAHVSGNDWVPLRLYDSMVAEVNANGQDLEEVSVKTYLNEGDIQHIRGQYYLGRSFKVNAKRSPVSPVSLRFYFSDHEVERLISAPDKTGISRPLSVYDLSVTRYSGPDEDGSIANNTGGGWSFFPAADVRKVPYLHGYYLEFTTKNFSEFWFAGEYIGTDSSLPVDLIHFSAKLREQSPEHDPQVVLEWQTGMEKDFGYFEIEKAVGPQSLLAKTFITAARIPANGAGHYSMTDQPGAEEGTVYYRLKMVDADQSFTYSAIRAVNVQKAVNWQVFPNPAGTHLQIQTVGKSYQPLHYKLLDMNGKTLLTGSSSEKDFSKEHFVDLNKRKINSGIYLLKIFSAGHEETFKILKE